MHAANVTIVTGYLRFPHLRGELLTFVAEDDVWLAPLDGGRAWRVTVDHVPASTPRLAPDGTQLAWTSWRDDELEVYTAPVDGGAGRRLTYWGSYRTQVRGWTPDGAVLAVTSAGESSLRRTWAHAVPLDGGPSQRLPYGPVSDVAFGPAGAVLLGSVLSLQPAWWKRYRGGTMGKVWLDRDGSGEFSRILSTVDGHIVCPMWVGERVAFVSDHEGVGHLYSCLPDGADLRRHSEPAADGHDFYVRHAATDGTRVVYQRAGELWLLDGVDAQARRLDIRLGGSRSSRLPYPIRAGRHLVSAVPDRTGRASAVEVRGTVHWLTHRDGPARALAVEPGVRARLPAVVPGPDQAESRQVVWVTDAQGDDALEFAPTVGADLGGTPRRVAAGALGRVLELAVSGDGRRVAIASHDGRLLLVEVESGEVRQVDRSEDGEVSCLAFSPDSAWLAWSHPGAEGLRHIRMANTTDLSTVDVTPLRFVDSDPTFTADGKHLAFLSVRSFDPIYDAHVFDLAFPAGCRPHLIPLTATTPSPFDPDRHGRPVRDAEEADDKKDEDSPRTTVDLEGLADRVVPFPVPAGRYSTLRAAKGGVLWLRAPVTGVLGHDLAGPDSERPMPVLERFDLSKLRCEVLEEDVDGVWVSGDGNRLVVWDGDKLRVVPADQKSERRNGDSTDNEVDIDLSRVRVVVDPAAEWRQSYDEAGRLMRDHFWRPDMGGVDWDGVLDRYRPLLDRIGSHDDLVDLLWEVQGELGCSHAYVTPSGSSDDSLHGQGLLGADIQRDADGVWRVVRVLPGETSDPHARSPLAAPGVAVRAGDALLAVNGRPVDSVLGPAPLLVGTARKPVELTVRPAGGGEPRRAVVVPTADEGRLRYHAWVADRRAYVHERSGGRVGYLHVPDMMGAGWAQLHRDLRGEAGREGLVVDVRENRGGHTSQLVVEKLARRVIGWDFGRGYRPTRYPQDAPRGPVVVVANEFSGSDGDIVNAAIKALGIGPVVGTRTWGGVIGIDMRYRLVDGTLVTQPRYATWLEGPGWGVENYGVDPDVEVVMTPQDWVAGRDPQLDTAVQIALDTLQGHPAAAPPEIPPLD